MEDLELVEGESVIRMRGGCKGKEKSCLAVTDTGLPESSIGTCRVNINRIIHAMIRVIMLWVLYCRAVHVA